MVIVVRSVRKGRRLNIFESGHKGFAGVGGVGMRSQC